MSALKLHPDPTTLALLAGGELPWAERLGVWLHARRCLRCREELEAYLEVRERAREETFDLLPEDSLEWERLEAELKANIRLGLAAGAIVDRPAPHGAADLSAPPWWRVAVVLGSLTVVLASGWYLRRPERHLTPTVALPADVLTVMETRDAGIGIQDQDGAMTLLRPAEQAATVAVDYGGGAKTQYVDGDTGQVTIHQVYVNE